MSDDLCPGACNNKYRHVQAIAQAEYQRAAAAERPPNPTLTDHDIDPIYGAPVWCGRCQDSIYFNLRRLPELAAQVGERRDGRLNTSTERGPVNEVTSTASTRTLSAAWNGVDEAVKWVYDWAEALADLLGHAGPIRQDEAGLPVRNITETTTYLLGHITAVLSAPFAVDFGMECVKLASSLERAAGRDRYVQRLPIRCPHCETRTLTRDDGAKQVDCRKCAKSWTEDEYERLASIVKWEQGKGA